MKVTVPVPAVRVPLFDQLPETVSAPGFDMVSVAPLLMVMFLHTAPVALMVGWKRVPEGIVTSVEEIGNVPLHQFEVVAQSVLVAPVHWPATQPLLTVSTPVPVVPK